MSSADLILETCYPHWGVIPDGTVSAIGTLDFMYKVPAADPPKKCVVKYEDEFVAFGVFYGKNERYLGFGLHILAPGFTVTSQSQWITVTDASSRNHKLGSMKVLVDFAPLRMISILNDGKRGISYQVSTRRKDTCL